MPDGAGAPLFPPPRRGRRARSAHPTPDGAGAPLLPFPLIPPSPMSHPPLGRADQLAERRLEADLPGCSSASGRAPIPNRLLAAEKTTSIARRRPRPPAAFRATMPAARAARLAEAGGPRGMPPRAARGRAVPGARAARRQGGRVAGRGRRRRPKGAILPADPPRPAAPIPAHPGASRGQSEPSLRGTLPRGTRRRGACLFLRNTAGANPDRRSGFRAGGRRAPRGRRRGAAGRARKRLRLSGFAPAGPPAPRGRQTGKGCRIGEPDPAAAIGRGRGG